MLLDNLISERFSTPYFKATIVVSGGYATSHILEVINVCLNYSSLETFLLSCQLQQVKSGRLKS